MDKHTSGPWTVTINTNATRTIYGQERVIATVENLSMYPGRETEANTALIAAAPDMLEMLKIIWVNIPSTVLEQYGLNEEEINSIIVKARGEE